MTSATALRELTEDDADAYVAHQLRHAAESGRDGELPYGPYSRDEPPDAEGARARWLKRRSTPLSAASWRRAWGIFDDDRVIGSVDLAGGELPTSLHRVDLGLGVERGYRRRGHGAALMNAALAWARGQAGVDWVDLGVFDGNAAALSLYEQLGFSVVGRTEDLFRVDDRRIDNVQMTLFVGSPRA